MKIIVDVLDSEQVFAMKVLNSLSFVKSTEPLSSSAVALAEDLKEAAEQVRHHKQGKIKLKTAQELIDEL